MEFPESNTYDPQKGRYYEGRQIFSKRFILRRKLGQGGMGQVWLALDTELGNEVALKFTAPELSSDTKAIADLRRAVSFSRDLTHPHIIRIYDFHTDAEEAAVSMEFMPGKNLSEWQAVTEKGYFEAEEIRSFLPPIAAALDYAHQIAKRSHRDIKPKNIMFDETTGTVKLADFDIGRRLTDTFSRNTGREPSGSLPYMGPQQLMGESSKVEDDVYSLGASLYELLTGAPPFFRGDQREQIKHSIPPSLITRRQELIEEGNITSLGDPIPQHWENIIAASLSKVREERPSSIGEMIQQMLASPQENTATPPAMPNTEGSTATPPVTVHPTKDSTPTNPTPPIPPINPIPPAKAASPPKKSRKALPLTLAAFAIIGLISWGIIASNKSPQVVERIVEKPVVDDSAVQETRAAQAAAESQAQADRERADRAEAERRALAAQAAEAAKPKGPSAASKSSPFENSLEMKFVPIGITNYGKDVLFSVWETRVQDFEAFVAGDSSYDYSEGDAPYVYDGKEVKQDSSASWQNPKFSQSDTHPVTCVSHDDAVAFCQWLTKKERASGKIGPNDEYRLPTDAEWSYAVRIGEQEDAKATPKEKDMKLKDVYPWGSAWPPPSGAGNYNSYSSSKISDDRYERTSPVGSFSANPFGIYDLGGNVWEWCGSYYDGNSGARVLRGGSWLYFSPGNLLSSYRNRNTSDNRSLCIGFRCVLVVSAR